MFVLRLSQYGLEKYINKLDLSLLKLGVILMEEVDKLQQQLKEMSMKVEFLESSLKSNQKELIKEALSEFLQQNKKDNLKTEVMRKFNRSRKNIIKQRHH